MTAVSVVIPAFNAGALLRVAVGSALSQEHDDFEVIVVDDGSTDGSLAGLPSDERLRVISQENAGKSVAMNRALAEAQGSYYCILDADDEMDPQRLARQAAVLDAEPDVAAVFCGHRLLLDGVPCAPRFRDKDREACRRDIEQFRMPAHDPTAMYRMSMVRGIEYDPELRIAQGYDYILRVGEKFPMLVLGETLYSYRVEIRSATRKDPSKRRAFVERVRRAACERRGLEYDELFADRGIGPVRNRDRDNFAAIDFMESVMDLRRDGRRMQAIGTGLRCAGLHPMDPYYHKALAYAVLPRGVVARLRGRRARTG